MGFIAELVYSYKMKQFGFIVILNTFLTLGLVKAQPLVSHVVTAPKMGTNFKLVFYTNPERDAAAISSQAFALVDSLNLIFSNYEVNSEINKLTREAIAGKKVRVSDPLWEVLVASRGIWKKTNRAFDITISPLAKLWRRAMNRKEFPEKTQLEEAKSLVGFKWVKFYPKSQSISLKKHGMLLDFGGIAKGFTADQIAAFFREKGIGQFLIDAGGDIVLGNAPPDEKGWKIALPNGGFLTTSNVAVATSGDRYRYLEWEGKRYSHIIDPRTGLGVTHKTTVTVIADTGIKADAYASAISVLGKKQGAKVAKKENFKVYFYESKNE